MDILYILGTGSKHDNIEIRMSLRSLCKYGKNIGRIIVAGDPVDWMSDEVIKVPVPVKYKRKHHEMMNRVQYCVENGIVDGEFLVSSDDHFYVKPTDFDHYPYYVKSLQLRNVAKKGERCYSYHLSLVQTRMLLERYGFPTFNFEQHCNTHLHAQVFRDFKWLVDASYQVDRGCPPTTLIMNAWLTTPYAPHDCLKRADVKIRIANTSDDIRNLIGKRECFSIGDSAFRTPGLMDFFRQEFPEKCKYER